MKTAMECLKEVPSDYTVIYNGDPRGKLYHFIIDFCIDSLPRYEIKKRKQDPISGSQAKIYDLIRVYPRTFLGKQYKRTIREVILTLVE